MTKRMSVRDARANFSEMLGSVHHTNQPVIIERNGKPYAVIISPKEFEDLLDHRWEAVEQIQERNTYLNPDEADAEVIAIVKEAQREQAGSRDGPPSYRGISVPASCLWSW